MKPAPLITRATSPADAAVCPLVHAAPYLIEQNSGAYTPEQHAVWGDLVRKRMPHLEEWACLEYLEGFALIGLTADHLPNLAEVSQRLRPRTGWSAVPVSGFLPHGAFFEMLSSRQFPTATWIRERTSLDYIPQPDIFHDTLGHIPMHAHQVFGDFLAHYGSVCYGIDDHDLLERLGRLFWYTVEFGLIRQSGKVKFYGSGVMSSHGESLAILQGVTEVRDFSLDEVLATPVKVDEIQKVLFAIESFDQIYEAMHDAERRLVPVHV